MKESILDCWQKLRRKTDGQDVAEYVIAIALGSAILMMVLASILGLDEYFRLVFRAIAKVLDRTGA